MTDHLDGVAHLTLSDTLNDDKVIMHGIWTPDQQPNTKQPPSAAAPAPAATLGPSNPSTAGKGTMPLHTTSEAGTELNEVVASSDDPPSAADALNEAEAAAAEEGAAAAAEVEGLNMLLEEAGLNAEGSFGPAEAVTTDAAAAAAPADHEDVQKEEDAAAAAEAPLDYAAEAAKAAAAAAAREARIPALAAWLRRHSGTLRGATITFSGYDDAARVLAALQDAAQAALDAGDPLPLSELHLKDKSVTSLRLGAMLCMLPRLRRLELTGAAGSMSGFDAPALGTQLTVLTALKCLRELHLGCYMPGLCFTRQMSAVLPVGLTSLAAVVDRSAVNANRQLDHLVNLVALTILDAPAVGGMGGGGAFEDVLGDGTAIASLPSLRQLSVGAHSVSAAAMKRLAPVLVSLAHVNPAEEEGLTKLTALTALTLLGGARALEAHLPSLVSLRHLHLSVMDEPHLGRALGALGQCQQLRSLDLVNAPALTAATCSGAFTALSSLTRLKLTRAAAAHSTEEDGEAPSSSSSTWGEALSQAQQLSELELDAALLTTQQPVLTCIVGLTRLALRQPSSVIGYNPHTPGVGHWGWHTQKIAIDRLTSAVAAEVAALRGHLQVVEVVEVSAKGRCSGRDGARVQQQLVKVLPPSCQVVVRGDV